MLRERALRALLSMRAGREQLQSYPPTHEDVLIELRPVLVFTDIVRPVGEIEPLELGAALAFPASVRGES
jgi:hypothetical protein